MVLVVLLEAGDGIQRTISVTHLPLKGYCNASRNSSGLLLHAAGILVFCHARLSFHPPSMFKPSMPVGQIQNSVFVHRKVVDRDSQTL